MLLTLSRRPEIAARLVAALPDVAISTRPGGWINRTGVYRRDAEAVVQAHYALRL